MEKGDTERIILGRWCPSGTITQDHFISTCGGLKFGFWSTPVAEILIHHSLFKVDGEYKCRAPHSPIRKLCVCSIKWC